MSPVTLRPAAPADFAAAARLILGEIAVTHRHCIQSETGATQADLAAEMQELHARGELLVILAERDLDLLGVVGCEFDPVSGRGWLRGPHAHAAGLLWPEIATALVRDVLARLPGAIHRLDSFLNVAHEEGNAVYRSLGFREVRPVHVYVAHRPASDTMGDPCPPLSPEQAPSCAALHDALFPTTYVTGRQLSESVNADHRIFVIAEGPTVLGYVAAQRENTGHGFVEFLGVAPPARGHGLGRRLLGAALRWLFVERGTHEVGLTADDENTDARSLYESVGLRLRYTGLNMRRET